MVYEFLAYVALSAVLLGVTVVRRGLRACSWLTSKALDAAHAAATRGKWETAGNDYPRVRAAGATVALMQNGIVGVDDAEAIATLHNAYPAMSAELRERRAREEEMAAELRALREVAEAAVAYRACREGMQPQGGQHTIQLRETRIALDAALARVPR